jgi:Flp pilus assembly protein TadG
MRGELRTIGRDQGGATAVEFALISPVLAMALIGLFDMGYAVYANTMLQGALQRAARDSTVEGAANRVAEINKAVIDEVRPVVPEANFTFTRKSYANFSDVGVGEDYTDANDNNVCDDGEAFEDANGNGVWDRDRGTEGAGGARDAVLYTVTMKYPRMFPMASLIGLPQVVTNSASTVLRNQPYDLQKSNAKLGNCA